LKNNFKGSGYPKYFQYESCVMNEWCISEPSEHGTLHDVEFSKLISVYYMSKYRLGSPNISKVAFAHFKRMCIHDQKDAF
jgi:hypothetical protein